VKLLLATTSRGKLREQKEALAALELEVVSLEEFPEVAAPDETGATFRENARLKALYYHRATGLAAIAEDAGLEVDFLKGAPGVESARWLGEKTPYEVKNARLIELLEGIASPDRSARYVSAVALAERGRVVFEHQATCEGRIAFEARGTGGFGYDPVFHVTQLSRTMAELSPEEKNQVSHRGQAMAALRRHLAERPR
jgi:XTP/dITP diphosphohydrolase